MSGCIWYTCVVHYNLLLMHATGLIGILVNAECMPNQAQCTLESPQLHLFSVVLIAAIYVTA